MSRQDAETLASILSRTKVTPQFLQALQDARIITLPEKNAITNAANPVQILISKIQSHPDKVRKVNEILRKTETIFTTTNASLQNQQLATPRSQKTVSPTRRKESVSTLPQAKKPSRPAVGITRNATLSRSQTVLRKSLKENSSSEQKTKDMDIERLFHTFKPIHDVVMGSKLELSEKFMRIELFESMCEKVGEELSKVKEDLAKKPDAGSVWELTTESMPLQKIIANQLDSTKKSFADYYAKLNSKMKGEVDKLIADKEDLDLKIETYKRLLEKRNNECEQLKEQLNSKQSELEQQKAEYQKTIQDLKDKLLRSNTERNEVATQTDTFDTEKEVKEMITSDLKDMDEIHDVNFLNPKEVENVEVDENANFPVLNIRDLTNVSLVQSVSDLTEARTSTPLNRSRRSSISCVSAVSTRITQEHSSTNTVINKIYHVTFNVHNCQNVNIGSHVKYNRIGSA